MPGTETRDRRPLEPPGVPRAGAIFVLCTERSGSTLLASCLGASPHLLAPPELHLLRFPTFEAWFVGYPPARASLLWLLRRVGLPDAQDDLRARFGGLSSGDVYRRLLELLPEGTRLVDKTPAYARTDDALARTRDFGGHWIWLVRHPVPMARSRIRRRCERRRGKNRTLVNRIRWPLWLLRHHLRGWTGRPFRTEVEAWVSTHRRIQRFFADLAPERRSQVRFEDLVTDPAATIGRLADDLGVEYTPAMLDPGRHAPDALAWGIGDQTVLRAQGIDSSAAGRGHDPRLDRRLPPAARELLGEFGYPVAGIR